MTYSTVTVTTCRYCGNTHGAQCPAVKAIEYNPDGTVKRVEFFAPNDYAPVLAPPPVITPQWPPQYPYVGDWQVTTGGTWQS